MSRTIHIAEFRCVLAFALVCALSTHQVSGKEYFVGPQGSDSNAGTKDRPFATIKKAASIAKPGDTCYLREGVYREILRPVRSGEPGAEITFANWQDEKVLISGTDEITGWRKEENGIYSAPMPWSLGDDNQIFAAGAMLTEACWPAAGEDPLFKPNRGIASEGTTTTLVCDDISGPTDAWKGARLWCAGGSAWICWTSVVTGYDAESHTLSFQDAKEGWYQPQKGSLFVLKGLRSSLRAPGQWFYDSQERRLLVIPLEGHDIEKLNIAAKKRVDAIDLSGLSYIRIEGIAFEGAGIRTDEESSHIVLENLFGRYVSHSNVNDVSDKSGVLCLGHDILVLSCDLGYSSSSVVTVRGHDNRIINCHIHHGGYGGLWRGTVALSGRRILFSHNTVRHAGRDLVNTHGLMESLVQYNDVSEAGWLTKDLAMFYGHNTDFANTQFRYNLVHDNHAEHCAMGIYFDHLSHNTIVHHNVIWNIGMDPTRVNNPSYCNLVFNNTCVATGKVSTFDHSKRDDLFASRYFNNVYNKALDLPDHVALYGNRIIESPEFRNPEEQDFRLKDDLDPMVGAYAPDDALWRAGCNLENPPSPLPSFEPPCIDWMNTVTNACFEFGTLEGWQTTDGMQAKLVRGNGWGNTIVGSKEVHATGTSKYELRLGPGRDGVKQVVTGLAPNVTYQVAAWGRVSDSSESIILGVKQYGGPAVSVATSSTRWVRQSVDFTTGPQSTTATIYLMKSTAGDGYAWCDNVTLPLTPAQDAVDVQLRSR